MRKFRFRFAAVEKVRKIREDEALRALGQAQKQVQIAQEKKMQLESEVMNASLRRERLGVEGAVSASLFALENDYITGNRQRIIWQEQAILRAKRGAEKALRAYLLARRHTHVIERLKERDLEQFKKERAKQEQKNLDDITSMRSGMRGREEEQALGVSS